MLGKLLFVLAGQALDLGQRFFTVRRQLKRMRSRIIAVRMARDPLAALQLVQHAGKPRPLDAERLPNACCERPGLASMTSSTEYCAGRTFIGLSVCDEVLEHPELQPAQEIAEVPVELAERELVRRVGVPHCGGSPLLRCELIDAMEVIADGLGQA